MPKDQPEISRRTLLGAGLGASALWTLAACGAGGSGGSGGADGGSAGGASTQPVGTSGSGGSSAVTPSAQGGDASGSSTATGGSGSADSFFQQAGPKAGADSISVLAYAAPQDDAIKLMTGTFKELTGITVNWTSLAEDAATSKAAIALGSGNESYDVVHTTSALMPNYASRKWLASLDKLSQDSDLTDPEWNRSGFGKTALELMSYGDVLYGAPMFVGTQLYYYRTDVFEKNGITSTPTTFAELGDVCAKIHSSDAAAIALRSAPSVSQMMFVWSAWMYAYGGKYYDTFADGKYSGVALNSPEAVQALTLYSDLLKKYGPTGATNWTVEDVVRAFTTGQVSIVQEGAVFGGTFNDPKASQAAGKVGTFVLPKGPAGTFIPYNNHGWTIAANSSKQKAAWLFLQWATQKSTLIDATQNSANFSTPPIASVYQSAAFKKRFGFDDYVASVTKTINAANDGHVSPFEGDPNYLPGTTSWATLGQKVCEQLNLAITGQATPKDAIAKAAEAMSG